MQDVKRIEWHLTEVTSPRLDHSVPVVAARDIPYLPNSNRLQNLSIYLPKTSQTTILVGTPVTYLPDLDLHSLLPRWHVHIHGGAWRDPQLTSSSIQAGVAHAFSTPSSSPSISAVVSINYTVSHFPTHPTLPYDTLKDNHTDPARDATHPDHVGDVLHGLTLLRSLGLSDGSYILSGHSCGACLAFQAILQPPHYWGLAGVPDPPRPAAILGLNGLYDLPELVHGLGTSHAHLQDDCAMFLGNAFGTDQSKWPIATPARFDPEELTSRVEQDKVPRLVVLDQSTEDQLVPMSQMERFEGHLGKVRGLRIVRGHRCVGRHAFPWEEGYIIWESLQDILKLLAEEK